MLSPQLTATHGVRPWLAHYPPEVPATLDYPPVPLTAFLEQAAARFGQRPCTVFYGKRLTYAQVLGQVRSFAGGLAAAGVVRGSRVAIMLPNCPQAVIAYYAVLLLGGVAVMVNPTYTARELEHVLKDADAQHLVALDLVWPTVAEVLRSLPVPQLIVTGLDEFMPWPLNWGLRLQNRRRQIRVPYGATVRRWAEVAAGTPVTAPSPAGPDDLALLQYTGGTTGLAKGCMLSHRNLVANCTQNRAWLYRMPEGEGCTIGALPFFHVYGMTAVMNYCVLTGSAMVLVPRFAAREILRLIARYRPAIFPGAPTMYIALLHHPDLRRYDLSSIEACVSGSAPLPREVQDGWEKVTGGQMAEGYGLSEASPITHCNPLEGERRAGTIGLPWPDTDARIVDPETGAELPPGEPGELWVRGPQVMQGYWNRPAETAAVLQDGWLRTGDIAVMDPDGYFRIVDRIKDVIIASGLKIFPRELEELLYAHPTVQEACVVGVPDAYRGETPKVFIVPKPGLPFSLDDLQAYLRANLAPYKVPKQYEVRNSLPKNLLGKVLRRVLRDEEQAKHAHPS